MSLASILPGAVRAEVPQRPDIVVILADDLGFSDLGAFGGEIRTPNLDRLAADGIRLTNFHVAPACSPTRAELLTSVDHHRTGFGTFAEIISDNQRGRPGYEGQLSRNLPTLPERLRRTGYRTVMSGKWHLGTAPWADPAARGFDQTFALIGGGSNHFGRARDGSRRFAETYTENGDRITELPEDFYSSDYFTSRLIGFLHDVPDRTPFFAYLAFTAPHYPLQAPPEDVARYRGRYDAGWAELYKSRFEAVRNLGLVPNARFDEDLHARLGDAWAALAPRDRAIAARKMEIYAAMVDRMDRNVGRLIDYLKSMGRYEHTVILFLSDNGPEGTELERSAHHAAVGRAMLAGSDNSLPMLGSAQSYSWYGPGWAHASAAPFAMFKHYPYEGGVRVPAILRLPGASGQIGTGFVPVRNVGDALMAWGGTLPETADLAIRQLRGPTDRETGWELWGRRAVREGAWKAVLVPDRDGNDAWRLFDIEADPSERVDLADREPAVLSRLIAKWRQYAGRNGVVLPDISGL